MALTSWEGVADAKEGSSKVGGQVNEAAEVAAGDGPVEELPDAQEADGVSHVTPKLGRWEGKHL